MTDTREELDSLNGAYLSDGNRYRAAWANGYDVFREDIDREGRAYWRGLGSMPCGRPVDDAELVELVEEWLGLEG